MASDVEFDILTDEDRRHAAYAICVLGMAATGATFGSMAGGQTLLGFLGGAGAGLFMCKTVEGPLKQKLFRSEATMTDREFLSLLRKVKSEYPRLGRSEVLNMLARSKLESAKYPSRYRV
jgi:hypothetical protein